MSFYRVVPRKRGESGPLGLGGVRRYPAQNRLARLLIYIVHLFECCNGCCRYCVRECYSVNRET